MIIEKTVPVRKAMSGGVVGGKGIEVKMGFNVLPLQRRILNLDALTASKIS